MIWSLRLFLLAIPFALSAACPITHAYFSKKYFEIFPKYSIEEQRAFLVGTLFPDIGYINQEERAHTHFDKVSLVEVYEEKNPFLAGMKFHSWLDKNREELVEKENIYTHVNAEFPGKFVLLKFIEDEIYFPASSWAETLYATLRSTMGNSYGVETYGVDPATMGYWNKVLVFYFMSGPSNALFFLHLSGKQALGITREEVALWNQELKNWAKQGEFVEWSKKLDSHIEGLLYRALEELKNLKTTS